MTSVTATQIAWSVTLVEAGVLRVRVENPDGKRSDVVNAPILRQTGVVLGYGPTPTIGATAPPGSVTLNPGDNIQAAITANANGTTFWLRSGTHQLSASLTPKTGNTFIGEFGAILEGSGWTPPDATGAAFRAVNAAIVNVTIQNLLIRNILHKGVYVFHAERNKLTGWTIDHCEIANCGYGIAFGSHFTIQHNYIHDCRHNPADGFGPGGAYAATGNYQETVDGQPNVLDDVLFFHNHFSHCGVETHVNDIINFVFRDNWFHDMDFSCMWCDGVGFGFLAEDNLVEDSGIGVHYEISIGGIIRRNTFRRTTDSAVYVSTSADMQIYENTFDRCARAVALFVNFPALGLWPWNPDLRDNSIHTNTITVAATAGHYACFLSHLGTGDLTPYRMPTNTRNNVFDNNIYTLLDPAAFPWLWTAQASPGDGFRDFSGWQAILQDLNGSSS